jgi:hypothetical protein
MSGAGEQRTLPREPCFMAVITSIVIECPSIKQGFYGSISALASLSISGRPITAANGLQI